MSQLDVKHVDTTAAGATASAGAVAPAATPKSAEPAPDLAQMAMETEVYEALVGSPQVLLNVAPDRALAWTELASCAVQLSNLAFQQYAREEEVVFNGVYRSLIVVGSAERTSTPHPKALNWASKSVWREQRSPSARRGRMTDCLLCVRVLRVFDGCVWLTVTVLVRWSDDVNQNSELDINELETCLAESLSAQRAALAHVTSSVRAGILNSVRRALAKDPATDPAQYELIVAAQVPEIEQNVHALATRLALRLQELWTHPRKYSLLLFAQLVRAAAPPLLCAALRCAALRCAALCCAVLRCAALNALRIVHEMK